MQRESIDQLGELLWNSGKEMSDASVQLRQAIRDHYKAKMAYIEARHTWEVFMVTGMYEGWIEGKNAEARSGHAISLNPDAWAELCRTEQISIGTESNLKVSQILWEEIERQISLYDSTIKLGSLVSG